MAYSDWVDDAQSQETEWVDDVPIKKKVEKEQGFFSRVGEDISKRVQNIKDIDAPTTGLASLWATGEVAGLGSDIIGQGLKSVYRTITPQATQDMFAEGARNVGEFYAKPISAVAEGYEELKQKYPNLVRSGEAVANIGEFIPLGKVTGMAGKAVGKEALNLARDVASLAGKEAEQQIHNTVRSNIERAVRPKTGGKSNFPRTETYYERATEAVKNIIDNKENLALTTRSGDTIKGALPRSLKQFSEAIDQTKKTIYNAYHSMALEAKDAGALFNTSNIIKKLDNVESDIGHSKVVRNYANKLKDDILELDGQSPDVIEKRIKEYNSSLDGYYADRVTKAQAQIDASVAQALREELDNTITNAVGAGYQPLRNKLMTLKTIEEEVAHRVTTSSRQNKKSLLDFTDIFTGGELVAGLMTMNPALIGSAAAQKGIKELYKHINSPDYMTKTMFSGVEDITKRKGQGFQSKSFQKLGSVFPDNPISEVSKGYSLTPDNSVKRPSTKGMASSRLTYIDPKTKELIFSDTMEPILSLPYSTGTGSTFQMYGEYVTLKGLRDYQKALKRKID